MRTREQQITRILLAALVLNILVASLKLAYGLWTHTLSMTADGIHSFTDAGSSVMGLIAIFYASRPSDDNHHYGHQKYETLAALGIGLFIMLTSWEILQHAIDRIIHPSSPQFHLAGVAIILITLLINLSLAWVERKKGEELKSEILRTDAIHTSTDVFVSLSVLVSLLAIKFGLAWVDPFLSLLLVGYFAFIAYRLLKENISVLSDAAFINPDEVVRVASAVPEVLSCHRVRTRGRPGYAFVDLHIQVDGKTDTATSHELVHQVEQELKKNIQGIQDVLIHTEPWSGQN